MPDYEFGSDNQVHAVPSAADALRAFEDEHLGADAPRFAGKLERGHGSLFQRLHPDKQKAHGALEKTVETEQKLADARAALLAAEKDHSTALEDASKFGG